MPEVDRGKSRDDHAARRPPAPTRPAAPPLQGLLALQRTGGHQATSPAEAPAPVQRSAVHDVLRAPGRPLDDATRTDMEARLGADFSDVRLHTDSGARASAAEIGARAYTSGNHIVIGDGGADKHTLAHELTHVIQQRQGPVAGTDIGAGLKVSDPADRFEREAESTARRVLGGAAPTTQQAETAARSAQRAPGRAIQRWTDQDTLTKKAMTVSSGGLFAVPKEDEPTAIWVRVGTPSKNVSPALRPTNTQPQNLFGTGDYQEHQLAREILDDCLHTAEEIMHDAVGELEDGHTHSNVRTTSGTLAFGMDDQSNRQRAAAFQGQPDRRAAPVVGQAYLMIAMNPGATVMSQYHAAAVVGVDRDDTVTMEAFAGSAQTAANPKTYTIGSTASFHDYWTGGYYSVHYPHVTMKTVVIGRRGKGHRVPPGSERPANPNVS